MEALKRINWLALITTLLGLYIYSNTTGIFTFFTSAEKSRHLQQLFHDHTVLLSWLFLSHLMILPFLFLEKLANNQYRKRMQQYLAVMIVFCLYGYVSTDPIFVPLMSLYATLIQILELINRRSQPASNPSTHYKE